jgi:hypothetical protein
MALASATKFGVHMTDKELQVVFSALDDCRRLIVAGKVQRWDVVKWGVAVNVGLATAAAAIPFKGAFSFIPFIFAMLVAIVSWQLVSHYNARATGARNTATHLVKQMKEKYGIDYDSIVGTNVASDYSRGPDYDREELRRFKVILFVSPVLSLLVELPSFIPL